MKSRILIISSTSFLCMFPCAVFPFPIAVGAGSTGFDWSINNSDRFMNSVATKYGILRSAIYDSPVAFGRIVFVSEKYL